MQESKNLFAHILLCIEIDVLCLCLCVYTFGFYKNSDTLPTMASLPHQYLSILTHMLLCKCTSMCLGISAFEFVWLQIKAAQQFVAMCKIARITLTLTRWHSWWMLLGCIFHDNMSVMLLKNLYKYAKESCPNKL